MPTDKTGHFYYNWYPTIYLADTQHLTLAQDGAYRRLIDHYMMTRSPLVDNEISFARIIGIDVNTWKSMSNNLLGYFKITNDGFWHHTMCDEVLAYDVSRIEKSRKNGKSGGRPTIGKIKKITHRVIKTKPSGNLSGLPITTHNITKESITPEILENMNFQVLPKEWRLWAVEEFGWSLGICEDVFSEFREYWFMGKGKKVKRSGWMPTWRNWCRKQRMNPIAKNKLKISVIETRSNVGTL